MSFITDLQALVDELAGFAQLDVAAADLPAAAQRLDSESVIAMVALLSRVVNCAERGRVIGAGILAERSARDLGYAGVAQKRGHRTPIALVQSITGGTRADAAKQVRLGESLLEGQTAGTAPDDDERVDAAEAPTPVLPWHEPLRIALLSGGLTTAQHDAILRGLGEPPMRADGDTVEVDGIERFFDEVREVWSLAAERLILAAPSLTAEDLLRESRRVRDLLHPEGAAERFDQRFAARSFRMWLDDRGQHRAHLVLDDEGAAWIRAMIDAALRPRRGGPRFITDEERKAAKRLVDDPRTNEQLEYDLLLAALRAGSLATAEQVFGARQPGVRIVVEKGATTRRDAFGRLLGVGHLEDRGDILAGAAVDRAICTSGFREIVVDPQSNPLQLGREQRLFTANQKIVMAVRDGGCLIPECSMPASYCEAHHIDHFARDEGKTDVDRGVLLCAFHHLLCHNNGWEVTRDDLGDFNLHPPPGLGEPIVLRSKSPLAFPLAS